MLKAIDDETAVETGSAVADYRVGLGGLVAGAACGARGATRGTGEGAPVGEIPVCASVAAVFPREIRFLKEVNDLFSFGTIIQYFVQCVLH